MEIATEIESKLKYNLAARIASVPNSQGRRLGLKRRIRETCGIHRNTLDKWMDIEFGSEAEIRYEHLKKLASIFNCEIEDLENK